MDRYDYYKIVKEDIAQYLKNSGIVVNESNKNALYKSLCDSLMFEQSVTGYKCGYTDEWEADEFLCHNMRLLAQCLNWFGFSENDYIGDSLACDGLIRTYLIDICLAEVLNEIEPNSPIHTKDISTKLPL